MLGIARWAAIVWCSLGQIIAVSFVCPNAQSNLYAPVNVKLASTARQGMGWGFDIFSKICRQIPRLPVNHSSQIP